MGLAIAQFNCFALLVASSSAKCSLEHKTRNDSVPKFAPSQDEFLAGEDTPVWLARYHPHNRIVYDRVLHKEPISIPRSTRFSEWYHNFMIFQLTMHPVQEGSTIAQSLNYWNSIKRKGGFRVRRKPKLDTTNPVSLAITNLKIKRTISEIYVK